MSTPFLGELRLISWNFPPKGWAFATGQLLPINQTQALFSLFGTTYGGNGQTNFGLPNLVGRCAISFGSGFTLGETGGELAHTLTQSEMPQHIHIAQANSTDATADIPTSSLVLAKGAFEIYRPPSSLNPMKAATISNVGGSQPHNNQQPFLTMNYIVALQGIFPSQN